jgi:hypothetical protein
VAKHLTNVGKYVFGSIVEPRTNAFGVSQWSVGLVLQEADAQPLFELIEQYLEEKRVGNARFPKTNDGLKMPFFPSTKLLPDGTKEEVPGEFLFKFVRKFERKNKSGELTRNTPPAIYDSLGRVINGKVDRISSGSTGKAVFEVYVYDNAGVRGVTFQLLGFQIAELKVQELELPPIEGGFVAEQTEDDDIAAVLAGN